MDSHEQLYLALTFNLYGQVCSAVEHASRNIHMYFNVYMLFNRKWMPYAAIGHEFWALNAPRPAKGAYSAPPDPPAVFEGPPRCMERMEWEGRKKTEKEGTPVPQKAKSV